MRRELSIRTDSALLWNAKLAIAQERAVFILITTRIRILLCFVSLTAFAATVYAQQPAGSPGENIEWPSPDEKFAFATSHGDDLNSIDLIDKKSGQKLQRIAELDWRRRQTEDCEIGDPF